MQWLRNRNIAWAITVILIFVAVMLGAKLSLGSLRDTAKITFVEGISKDEPGIQYDIDWLLELSSELVDMSGHYMSQDDTEWKALTKARAELEKATTPKTKFVAAERLVSKSTSLIYTLDRMKLEAQDKQYSKRVKVDIESRWLILGRNAYNERAMEFNNVIKRLPVSVVSKLVSVEPLELFAP